MHIQLVKGKVKYYYNVVATNGNILSTSQKYWSKGNADRAARKLGTALTLPVMR